MRRGIGLLAAGLLLTTAATLPSAGATPRARDTPVPTPTPAPTIVKVGPQRLASVGGVRVTITGTGFTQVTRVRFGLTPGSGLRVLSPTRLTVLAPVHRAATVPVRVLTQHGSSALTRFDRVTFHSPLVVLDPGHDGGNETHIAQIDRLVPAGYGVRKPCNTTGTATNSGYPEHAFNWDVARRVRAILVKHHVRVILTHSSDHQVGPCVNVRARIESRPGVAAAIAIHADGAPSSGHGFHVNEDSRRPVGASAATVAKSTRLGLALRNSLATTSGLTPSTYIGRNGLVRRDDFAGLNLSTNPTSFLELGNMRNPGDAAKQKSPAGRERIARAVAAGLIVFLRR